MNDESLDAIMSNAPLAIIVVNANGSIETANPQAETMFGYASGELTGQEIEILLPEGLRAKHVQARQQYNRQPYTRAMGIGMDLVARRKDGSQFPVEVGLSHNQLADGHKITCFVSDISPRKQLDERKNNTATAKQARLDSELKMAHEVQASFLPRSIPKIEGWSLAVKYLPAGELAGDFYQCFPRSDGELDLVIADVVDKGVPAALFMSFTHPILREVLKNSSTPAESVTQANLRMCQESSMGLFASLFLARLQPNSGKLVYVNAGHNPPIHYHARNDQVTLLEPSGMVLGIDTNAKFQQHTLQLASGDMLVFYTDGVTEAMNAEEQTFGMERLIKLVKDHHCNNDQEIVEQIGSAV